MEGNFSNRVQDVIRLSREEALRLGHGDGGRGAPQGAGVSRRDNSGASESGRASAKPSEAGSGAR